MDKLYDVLIVGGGPAGYTAALYCARAGLSTVVLEKLSAGGQIALTEQVDNYPGFDEGIDGFTLGQKMEAQAERFGAETQLCEVLSLDLTGKIKVAHTTDGDFRGRTVLLATGANPRPLGVADEEAWLGRGIHYCAACDGMFYRGKTVAVVGGGNTAAEDALYLAGIGCPVTLIHRRDALRADQALSRRVLNHPLVTMAWNSVVERIQQTEDGLQLHLRQLKTDQSSIIQAAGCFVAVGTQPQTGLFAGQVDMDPEGYIAAGEDTHTSLPGVFAAGDLRRKPLLQVITAAADGAVAASQALQYIRGL